MNIEVQCCGLVLLVLLLFFYMRQRTVGLYTEKIFSRIWLVTFISVALDIFSVIMITNRNFFPHWLLNLVCKSYPVSLVCVSFAGLTYVLTDLYKIQDYRKIVHRLLAFPVLAAVIIFALPIHYFQNGNVIYTYGPSIVATYVAAVALMNLTVGCIIRFRRRGNPRRKLAVLIWMGIWLVAAVVQFFDNELLLVGFASSLGVAALFVMLENPESNMDRSFGCFNSHALQAFLKQCFEQHEKYSMLVVRAMHSGVNPAKVLDTEWILHDISKYSYDDPSVRVFKNVGQELVILFPDEAAMEHAVELLRQRLFPNGENVADIVLVLLADGMAVQNPEELFQYILQRNVSWLEANICRITPDMIVSYHYSEKMRLKIIAALNENRVEIFLQPIYSLRNNKFTSAEALVRIRELDGSVILPNEFIPIAEEARLIKTLGERIFDMSCKFLNKQVKENLPLDYLEINLSVVQCEQNDLSKRFIDIIEKYRLPPSMINLEITETASIRTKQRLLENMAQLISYGSSFSLDDFGSGQSNLNYIVSMPVAIVKLDMNMTKSYFTEPKAKYVVRAAVRMIHEIGLSVVAEGVETENELQGMRELGVDYIQGYYFSMPLPMEEFVKFIRAHALPKKYA